MRTRIIFFGALALALTLSAAIPHFAQDARVAPSDADRARHSLAVSILRVINTMEVGHRMEYGSYLTWNDLVSSREFTDDVAKCAAENETPLAGAHFAKGPEILPGWSLRLDLTDGGKAYDLLLEDTMDKTCGYAAVTDERGIIRQSKAIDCPI
jgi:hypothetical protein